MPETLFDQIDMLRVQLEKRLPIPSFIVVSSACENDGKSLVASRLARSMSAAGYSTLLVLADERHDAEGAIKPKSLGEISELGIARYLMRSSLASSDMMVLPTSDMQRTISKTGVARFGETCRNAYKITIIETTAMLSSSFAMLAALLADGVLLTIRHRRRVCINDHQLAKMLAQNEMRFLGVVSVAESAIPNDQPDAARRYLVSRKGTIENDNLETNLPKKPFEPTTNATIA
jgi:polysaccharide biosynthesis transport protein